MPDKPLPRSQREMAIMEMSARLIQGRWIDKSYQRRTKGFAKGASIADIGATMSQIGSEDMYVMFQYYIIIISVVFLF